MAGPRCGLDNKNAEILT